MFTKITQIEEKQSVLRMMVEQRPMLFLFGSANEKCSANVVEVNGYEVLAKLDSREVPAGAVTLNYTIGGFQYFIKTRMRQVPPEDEGVFEIDFNADLYKLQRRKNFRIKVPESYDIDLHLMRVESHSVQQDFRVENLSTGGLALLIEEGRVMQAQPEQEFVGKLYVNSQPALELKCSLRYVKQVKGYPGYVSVAGVQFVELSERDEQYLFSLVMDLHRKQFASH